MFTRAHSPRTAQLAILLVAVILIPASQLFAAPPPTQEMWLGLTSLTMKGNPAVANSGSFTMTGMFNLQPNIVDPAICDVTLTIDNAQVIFYPSDWTNKGPGKPWVAKIAGGNITASIYYWVGGTSKCKFTFTAKKQSFSNSNFPHMPELPVQLQIYNVFDQQVIAGMETKGYSAKMTAIGPKPAYQLNAVTIKTSPKAHKDSVTFSGRMDMDTADFDPSVNGALVEVEGETVEILPGELPVPHGRSLTFRKTYSGTKKLTLTANLNTGKVTIMLTGLDLGPVTDTATVRFAITNYTNADWVSQVWMSSNKANTTFKY
jgi:hypothetical protein